ncbi:hypothetical protein L195_g048161, partial [Trifolium pratense]
EKEGKIIDMVNWSHSVWEWKVSWTRQLESAEQASLAELVSCLESTTLNDQSDDRLCWLHEQQHGFTVSSCYTVICSRVIENQLDNNLAAALSRLWQTKHQQCCVFCFSEVESLNQLFFACRVAKEVWRAIFNWIGWHPNSWGDDDVQNFLLFNGKVANITDMVDRVKSTS